MNDPNGLVYFDGTYHLYFQYNPDLVTWTEHQLAIRFTATETVFSGSVVVDFENTSGFGDGSW